MEYILYDGHIMEKYIPHVYVFTGLKMIHVLTFFFYLLQQNRLRPWRRRLTRSEHLKIENRIKQINTFITDNRHLIKKVNTVSKCLHQCRRRRGQSVFKLLLLWTKKKTGSSEYIQHIFKTKINRERWCKKFKIKYIYLYLYICSKF